MRPMSQSPLTLQRILSDALGEWAARRASSNQSQNINLGPVCMDAARHLTEAVTAAAAAEAAKRTDAA